LVEVIAIVQKKPANWDFLIASAVMFVVGLLAYMNKVSADPYMPIEGSSYAVYAFPAFIASLYLFIVSITKSFFRWYLGFMQKSLPRGAQLLWEVQNKGGFCGRKCEAFSR